MLNLKYLAAFNILHCVFAIMWQEDFLFCSFIMFCKHISLQASLYVREILSDFVEDVFLDLWFGNLPLLLLLLLSLEFSYSFLDVLCKDLLKISIFWMAYYFFPVISYLRFSLLSLVFYWCCLHFQFVLTFIGFSRIV